VDDALKWLIGDELPGKIMHRMANLVNLRSLSRQWFRIFENNANYSTILTSTGPELRALWTRPFVRAAIMGADDRGFHALGNFLSSVSYYRAKQEALIQHIEIRAKERRPTEDAMKTSLAELYQILSGNDRVVLSVQAVIGYKPVDRGTELHTVLSGGPFDVEAKCITTFTRSFLKKDSDKLVASFVLTRPQTFYNVAPPTDADVRKNDMKFFLTDSLTRPLSKVTLSECSLQLTNREDTNEYTFSNAYSSHHCPSSLAYWSIDDHRIELNFPATRRIFVAKMLGLLKLSGLLPDLASMVLSYSDP